MEVMGGSMQQLTPFQGECRAAVDEVLGEFGIASLYETHDAESATESSGRVFLRTQFARGEDRYDLYIYPDEAALNVSRTWFAFERHVHDGPEGPVVALVEFLRGRLQGTDSAG
jgi:hypothetical protein